mmetsp:Transcript_4960/g.4163  ORF Transcript_4960/g.4163 Transcript_4960/m.4163 type:complete len:164 (+) Transcript_4960:238-729(+)
MIESLEGIGLEGWPQALMKILKANRDSNNMSYQTDIYWADFNYNNNFSHFSKSHMSLINREGSINSHNGSNSGSVIEGVIVEETDNIKVENSNNNNQNNVNNNMGVMVSSMLETSEILDERFYEDHNRPTWMNKSFDLKTIENPNSDRPDSFIFTVESSNPTP